jgi:hypothetical protein
MSFTTIRSIFRRRAPRTELQILSDLHLEVGQQYADWSFPVAAPYLVLGGDIGRLIDYEAYVCFLNTQAARYKKVFLILGNHEFYGLSHTSGLAKARQLCSEPSLRGKVVLMDRTRWDDEATNVTLLGCTLWSSIPPDASATVQSKISDFKKIEGWTVEKHNEAHEEDLRWLRDQVKEINSNMKDFKRSTTIVVLTHHAPCLEGTSRPEHASNSWTSGFATDLIMSDEIEASKQWPNVKFWAFGHTHYTTDITHSGIRLIANQRGYVLPGDQRAKQKEGQKNLTKRSILSLSREMKDIHQFQVDKVITT